MRHVKCKSPVADNLCFTLQMCGITREMVAHQDLNLGPIDYELARYTAKPAKSRVADRNVA